MNDEEQFSLLLKIFRTSYEQDVFNIEVYEDEKLKDILLCTFRSDAPAFIFKILAETYNKDFWELWAQIKDVAKRRWIYGSESVEAAPISTVEFFWQNPDDMILFWEGDGKIEFSDDLMKWFVDLKIRYDELMKTGFAVGMSLKWILNLMEYAHVGLVYRGKQPRRRLQSTWDMMSTEKRENKARVTFRRYMALVANRKLRKAVFGF